MQLPAQLGSNDSQLGGTGPVGSEPGYVHTRPPLDGTVFETILTSVSLSAPSTGVLVDYTATVEASHAAGGDPSPYIAAGDESYAADGDLT